MKTLFGEGTQKKIDLLNIKEMHKATNYLFDNSIQIMLRDGSDMFLTSFINRDECYDLILEQLKRMKGSGFKEERKVRNQRESRVEEEK